ncbi:MAG: polysaccharide deacetylase family protein [Patescibacteria group bacterium]
MKFNSKNINKTRLLLTVIAILLIAGGFVLSKNKGLAEGLSFSVYDKAENIMEILKKEDRIIAEQEQKERATESASTTKPTSSDKISAARQPRFHHGTKKITPPTSFGKIRVPILMYHYIEPVPTSTPLPHLYLNPQIFEDQLKTIKNASYNTVFVRDIGENIVNGKSLPDKPIALTFDDGYEDFYTNIFPLLKKYQVKATFYIIVYFLNEPGYLTDAQIKELADSDLVEIASHTLDHPDLRQIGIERARRELKESRTKLAQISGHPVDDFAYPFGFFSSRDERVAKEAGYLTAASTYPGTEQSKEKIFSLYRLRPGSRSGQYLLNWLEEKLNM